MTTASEPVWRTAWLGLGGNVGDPAATMAAALAMLDSREDVDVTAVSRLYRTPPWGKTDQAWFFNACAMVSTSLSPEALLETCLATERAFKRVRAERWGPRTIDIDLLFMEGVVMDTGTLTLPHPRMTERGFVIVPLADIAAGGMVAGRPVSEWLDLVDRAGIEAASTDGSWWQDRPQP